MTQPPRDASGKFVKRDPIVGISHNRTYTEHLDQPLEYAKDKSRVPAWVWMRGLAALIIAAVYEANQLAGN